MCEFFAVSCTNDVLTLMKRHGDYLCLVSLTCWVEAYNAPGAVSPSENDPWITDVKASTCFSPPGSSGKTPPWLLIVDKSFDAEGKPFDTVPRNITVTCSKLSGVIQTMIRGGCAPAGFSTCNKAVTGGTVTAQLRPGEGVLVALSVWSST